MKKRVKIRNKKKGRAERRILVFGIIALIAALFAILANALTDDERSALQNELNNLTSQLSNQGHDWLVDYNISYPYVSVFREGSSEEIVSFPAIMNERYSAPFSIMEIKNKLNELREKLKDG